MKKKICTLLLFGTCIFSISACGNKETSNTSSTPDSSKIEDTLESRDTEESKDNTDDEAETQTGFEDPDEEKSSDADSESSETKEDNSDEELVDGMRPEFKEAMDSYEAFYNEYCDIVKKYSENPSDMKLLADYTDVLAKATEMTEKFDAWENNDLNNAELEYYLDVNNRITKKLLEVSQ